MATLALAGSRRPGLLGAAASLCALTWLACSNGQGGSDKLGGASGDRPTGASGSAGAPGTSDGSIPDTGGSSQIDAGSSNVDSAVPSIGAPMFDNGELDPPSNGGTITFQTIGASGWYPSRRDPAAGQCDAYRSGDCCMTKHELTGDKLTPWDEELIMTLRGPIVVKQLAVYQPTPANPTDWQVVSAWDARSSKTPQGLAFSGNGTEQSGFTGVVGSECLVDISSERSYPCGPGSAPYCPPTPSGQHEYYGWEGSKLLVLLASMPHAGSGKIENSAHCSQSTSGGWYDAPWVGLSHGELIRSGKFGNCHCYAKNPTQWQLADGCGQFNVFEVVNDNNQYKNLDVFSSNFFGYAGYVGEGPCGTKCNLSGLAAQADLINKANSAEASMGAVATPSRGPGAAFRRPSLGYRYFLMLLDADARAVQLAVIHPQKIPDSVATLLPNLPRQIPRTTLDSLLAARLPR